MHEKHYSPQPKLAPSSPQFEEACRASARKYAKRSIRLGLIFRGAQQEAYESWVELDKRADAQEEASAATSTRDEALSGQDEARKSDDIWAALRAAEEETYASSYVWAELIDEEEEGLVELPLYALEKSSETAKQRPQEQQRALMPIGKFVVESVQYITLLDTTKRDV